MSAPAQILTSKSVGTANRRIVRQILGVVNVLVAGKAAKDRLKTQTGQQITAVPSTATVRERRVEQIG
jgi:hypothetical protein